MRAALHSCNHAARLLADALAVLTELCDKDSQAPHDEVSQYEKTSHLAAASLTDALDHANETLSHGPNGVAVVGTNPAQIVRTYVSDLVPVKLVQVRDRPVHSKTTELCRTTDSDESFSLTETPATPPSRSPVFNPRLFAEFWEAYPRHVGKKDAVAAFTRIGPTRAEVALFVAAIEQQRGSRDWVDGFIPHPATWLNKRRWEDEIEAPRPLPPARQTAAQARAAANKAAADALIAELHAADSERP
jgi:hypothetical protein